MREIKFRAWDAVGNWMGEVTSIDYEEESIYIDTRYLEDENQFKFDEAPLMQYTGLKDKNGVEIYEGDIIQADESSPIGNVVTARVYFKDAGFALLTTRGSDTSIGYLVMIYPFAEVIGNIYEHRHLLEETK